MGEFYSDTPSTSMEAAMQASYRARKSATAHGRVAQMVIDYGSMQTMHPAVSVFRRSQADDIMFQQAMTNDYKLLCNRSLVLEDFEVNVYEAAFSKLMSNVKTHLGAIHLYVEEILGLRAISHPLKLRALTNAVRVRSMILNFAANGNQTQPSPMLEGPSAQHPHVFTQTRSGMQLLNHLAARSNEVSAQHLFSNESSQNHGHTRSGSAQTRGTINHSEQPNLQPTQMEISPRNNQNREKLSDLLSAYHDATANFRMCPSNTTVHLTFARVLCDKAEQCWECMRELNPRDMRLDDVYRNYAEAKQIIELGEASQGRL